MFHQCMQKQFIKQKNPFFSCKVQQISLIFFAYFESFPRFISNSLIFQVSVNHEEGVSRFFYIYKVIQVVY